MYNVSTYVFKLVFMCLCVRVCICVCGWVLVKEGGACVYVCIHTVSGKGCVVNASIG